MLNTYFVMKRLTTLALLLSGAILVCAQVLTPQKSGKLWGYADEYENFVVKPAYTAVGSFCSGYAWVNKGGKAKYDEYVIGGKFGVVNYKGELVCPVEYDFVDLCYGDIVAVNKGGVMTEEDYIEGGKWGYYDLAARKELVSPQYEQVSAFYPDGVAWVQKGGNMVYKLRLEVEKDGKGAIKEKTFKFNVSPKYRLRSQFKKFNSSGKWAIIDLSGKQLCEFSYSSVGDFRNTMAYVYNGGYGAMNVKGELTVPCIYEHISDCYEGGRMWAYKVDNGDKSEIAMIDTHNNVLTPFKYQKAFPVRDSVAWVQIDGKFAIVDINGKELTDFNYQYHGPFCNNVAWISDGKQFGLINNRGKEIVPIRNARTQLMFGRNSFVRFNRNFSDGETIGWVLGFPEGYVFDTSRMPEITKTVTKMAGKANASGRNYNTEIETFKLMGMKFLWYDENGNLISQSDECTYNIKETIPDEMWDY